MTTRTTQTIVHFAQPFHLPHFASEQPAGDYRVDHDEELIGGNIQTGWLRTASYIHLPAIGVTATTHQMVPIKPGDLDAVTASNTKRP